MRRAAAMLAAALLWQSIPPPAPSAVARAYLGAAIGILEANHINRATVEWPALTAWAEDRIAGARAGADVYPAIRGLLRALGERHSFLLTADQLRFDPKGAAASGTPAPMPAAELRDGRVGVVRLPGLLTVAADGPERAARYSAMLRAALERLDRAPLCGWIIDLRANDGGNMWPMLAGLDPLLGAPPFGFFVQSGRSPEPWGRFPGAARFGLAHAAAPLAVLVGPRTGSSGEMVAIAFAGRARTRSFGIPTAGLATVNRIFPLADGALLVVTVSAVRDRTGRDYRGAILPDAATTPEGAETAAARWLFGRCAPR
ncbi:S41 family peptidase [Sphingomonas sp.]|uniref:S41 family peptidase n=1 Tax=Sphingomonas sp. TaxID=28214 RepID=UPI001B2D106A|nr:S41 family peptidase [Sphingomonas sp.]MBO9712905.1 S41 family peptidase [Sphingomonas sp.]